MNLDGYNHLQLEVINHVLRVTLNRPERRNALSPELLTELAGAIAAARDDPNTRVLILRGAGADFCSGYDITPAATALPAPSPAEAASRARDDREVFDRLWTCPIPTIAQVHGHCLAAGTDLAMSCDLIICATNAMIGYPPVRSMGTPTTHMWIYHLGPQWTKRLLLTGDSLTGTKAANLGLTLTAIDPAALDESVLTLATRISQIPRDLLIANKHVINHGLDLMGRTLLQDTAATQTALCQVGPDAATFSQAVTQNGVRTAVHDRDAPFTAEDPIP